MGAAEQKARSPIVQDLVLGVEDGEHWRGDGNVWIQFCLWDAITSVHIQHSNKMSVRLVLTSAFVQTVSSPENQGSRTWE